MILLKFKRWIVLFAILGCTSEWLIRNQGDLYRDIFGYGGHSEVLGAISVGLLALSLLNILRVKYGRYVLKAASAMLSTVGTNNEDKTMDKMLKLKKLYDSELKSKDEYDMKLAKLKRLIT